MWRNYLTVAFRTLARSPAYAAVNIGGLALGLAGSLLILAYVNYERSYDSWLRDVDRVYQVQTTVRPPNMAEVHSQTSPFPLYEGLAGFSQVEAVTSLAAGKTVTEHDGQPMFIDATTVDPEFFKVFALPFAQGSAATAFPDVNSIVLTESEAIRQFGTANALGKLLSLGAGGGKRDHRVTGVLRDLPKNTSLRLGIIFRRDINQMPPESRSWGNNDQQHYVKLRAGADAAAVNAALPAWKKRAWPPGMFEGKPISIADAFDFHLVPLGDVHLGRAQGKALTPAGDPRALATFAIVALLTLGMAVMNFVNLTTARATQRAREVALRKVLGATRGQLIVQFLGESLLIAAAAMLIALTIAELATPWIGHLMGAEMRVTYLGERGMLLPALGLFAVTGLAGGLYPALYLSRFRPAQVLRTGRAAAETPGSGRLRAVLVVVQFAVAIGLIASTAVIWSQTRFIERVDPGYRRDGLIQITNAWRFTQGAEYEAARPLMLAVPGVTGVGRAGLELGAPETPVRLMRGGAGAPWVTMGFYSVDADFLSTMGIGRLAGRLLGDRFAADRIAGATPADLVARGVNVVINRSAAAKLGYRTPEAAVGQRFEIAFTAFPMVPSTIVGVVEDTRFRTARDAVDPIVYVYDPEHTSQVLVRYAGARPGEVMAGLNKVWRRFEPEIPFEARFADDIVRELYAAERARGALFAAFSALAVVIACLGLYSLAAFATERRTKEIGIRKVVGATVRDIVRLLVWQFSKPVVLANLIAWPAAWWAMRDWLNGFDARIALGPGPFAIAGLLALAIAVATVAGHALRVARMNPIHALRYE
ncbi:ABC transporter permease [Sphingomonas cannabina]|uniref:ABC transporter permease n=1 Tax=Sphingomonas cannabina TaxID=2899123 RepID=UPI001F1A1695|nr:ABC transporter permease [Sphingomonas cannabina]UIJ46046.1 ABC transporter permease [Sphingomonas cannabina]